MLTLRRRESDARNACMPLEPRRRVGRAAGSQTDYQMRIECAGISCARIGFTPRGVSAQR